MGEENIEALICAIVKQAVKDWRTAVRRLKRKPGNKEAQALRSECEAFFRSEWFRFLTDADGRYILKKLQEEL